MRIRTLVVLLLGTVLLMGSVLVLRAVQDDVGAPPTTASPSPDGGRGTGRAGSPSGGGIEGIEPEAHSHTPPYADGNGNLYRIVEEFGRPEPNHNTPRMMRSADGGSTWSEVDAENRPTDDDLEGGWFLQSGTTLVYVYTDGGFVSYSEFHTSDAAVSPDRWVTTDERGVGGLSAGSQQWACVARTGDGQAWVFFADDVQDGRNQLSYVRRESPGVWTRKTTISLSTESLAGGTCVTDPSTDTTYVFYHDYLAKQVLYRSLTSAGELQAPVRVDDVGTDPAQRNWTAVTNPVVYTADGSTVVTAMYASAAGVRAVSIVDGVVGPGEVVDPAAPSISPPNTDENTGNDGPVMHLAVHGTTVHALWAAAETGDVHHSSRTHGGEWSPPVRLVDSGAGHVSWLYGSVLSRGGEDLLAYTVDLGPHPDDAGDIRYAALVL